MRVLPPAVKRTILQNRRRVLDGFIKGRTLSGRLGPLPSFLIIGFGRCGTTYLYDRLLEHPNVCPALVKEIDFFTTHYEKGEDWYRAHFASALNWRGDEPVIVGEASVGYVIGPRAPHRIASLIPDVKIIVMVRNPVDRAHSHFHHNRRLGIEPLESFDEAIDAESERLAAFSSTPSGRSKINGYGRAHFSYLSQGFYADYLERWIDIFPSEQLLVIQSEEFYRNPSKTLGNVSEYIGLPDWQPHENVGHKQFSYPKMSSETRQRLTEISRPHNERLFALVGETYGWDVELHANGR